MMVTTTTDSEDGDGDRTDQDDRRDDPGDDPEVARRVRARSEAVADREVEEALRRLEARGDLSDGQRRAVREMADGIVESLVAAPAETVAAAEAADDEALRTVVALFDPGE